MAGIPGALLSTLGTVLPPLAIITAVSYFYIAFRENSVINALLFGMQAGVAAVIVDVVINMGLAIIKDKRLLPVIMMFLSFVATAVFDVNIVVILFICGAIGAYTTYRINLLDKKEGN